MRTDFVIITAREDEYQAIAERFTPCPWRGTKGRTYGISRVRARTGKNYTIAIGRCWEQGPNAAQQLAHDMIAELNPSLLLVVGIADAIPDTDFTLGDVIISSRIHDFSINAYKPEEIQWDVRGGIHPLVSELVATLPMYDAFPRIWNDPALITAPRPTIKSTEFKDFDITLMTDEDKKRIFDGLQLESWQKKIISSLKWHFGDSSQRSERSLHQTGSIASSGSLMRDSSRLIYWLQNARSIRAVETKVSGVFQAAQQLHQQYPVMAICGISDIIGLAHNPAWIPYACHSAAAFAHAFIQSGIFNAQEEMGVIEDSGNWLTTTTTQPSLINAISQASTTVNRDQTNTEIQLYISYAEKDEELKKELEMHLSLLKHQGLINAWHSRRVGLGKEKDKEVDSHIDTAQIILLLVSPDFVASDYCREKELWQMMKRHTARHARVVPIILRSTDWHNTPFGKLVSIPRNNRSVSSWRNRDQAWYEISGEISQFYKEIRAIHTDSSINEFRASHIPPFTHPSNDFKYLINNFRLSTQEARILIQKLCSCEIISRKEGRDAIVRDLEREMHCQIKRDPQNTLIDISCIVEDCEDYSGGFQKLIDALLFYEKRSRASLDVAEFLKELSDCDDKIRRREYVEKLKQLMKGISIDGIDLKKLYVASMPPLLLFSEWRSPRGNSKYQLEQMMDRLTNIINRKGEVPALFKFIERIAIRVNDQHRILQRWIESTAEKLEIEPQALSELHEQVELEWEQEVEQSLIPREVPPYLLIQLKPAEIKASEEEKQALFSVEAWLHYKDEIDCLYVTENNTLFTADTMPGLLSHLLEEVALHPRIVAAMKAKLVIEFFLPRELFYCEVENWTIEEDDIPLGIRNLVVIRASERIKDIKNKPLWDAKWDRFHTGTWNSGVKPVYWLQKWEDCDNLKLYAHLIHDNVICLCLMCEKPVAFPHDTKDPLGTALNAGIPIALWLRRTGNTEKVKDFQNLILSLMEEHKLSELPYAILEQRREAHTCGNKDHLGYYTALLWDDPKRLPPQSQLQAWK